MNNRLIPVLLIFFVSFPVSAQSDSTTSLMSRFVSIHSGVMLAKPGLAGKPGTPTSLSITLMPGVRVNRVTMTVGVGYDTYSTWKLVPVFAGVSYDIVKGRNYALFAHYNAGYARAWQLFPGFGSPYKNEGGYFHHPFVGFRIQPGGIVLYFSAGYKFQSLIYEQESVWSWSGSKTTTRADMQRLTFQIGIGI